MTDETPPNAPPIDELLAAGAPQPTKEVISPTCATCSAPIEVPAGVDPRGRLCTACDAKLTEIINDPALPSPTPAAPREAESGPLETATHADIEKAPELEKAMDEATAGVFANPVIIHANYCKTKASEPGVCSCGADPSVPQVEETLAAPPVRQDPILFSTEKAKALLSVDIMGNGPGFIINDHATGEIIPFPSGLQVAFMPQGIAAIFGIPTEFLDGPEVPPAQRRIQVTNVRVVVAKMMMCTRPSMVRLKNKGDEWWGAAISMLHTLEDTDRFEFATAPPDETPEAPAVTPEQLQQLHSPEVRAAWNSIVAWVKANGEPVDGLPPELDACVEVLRGMNTKNPDLFPPDGFSIDEPAKETAT